MRAHVLPVALAVPVVLASCGADDAPPPPVTFSMTVRVEAGQELLACQFVKMPDADGEIFVSGGSYETGQGMHHFLLFRTAPDMPPQPLNQPVDCNEGAGVMQYERGYVSGGMLERDNADFPFGLALPFASGEVLMMQSHIVNASPTAVDATAAIELRRLDPKYLEARVGTFRFYNPFIYVPPNGATTANMRCPIANDVTLLTAGAHMHARGIGYRAFADIAGAAPAGEPFYTTTEWQHPDYYVGGIGLPAGSSLRFSCDYANPTDRAVVQGPTADDEMCMLSAFYYPAQGYDDEICAGMDSHGAGSRSCAQTLSCIQLCDPADAPRFTEGSAAVGACFQKCVAESCANVTGTLFPQLLCTQAHCAEACAAYGAECSACVQDFCKPELDACQALACDP